MNSLNIALVVLFGVVAISCALPQYGGSSLGGSSLGGSSLGGSSGGYGHHGHATSSQNLNQHHGHQKEIKVSGGHYKFKYGVHDSHTHDIKSQEESRDGDVVKGVYELHEPDGTRRIVKYVADHHNGFNAEVIREGKAHHEQPRYHHSSY